MLKKFRAAVIAATVLWLVVLVQVIMTRVYVSHTAFTQAFARNKVTVVRDEAGQQAAAGPDGGKKAAGGPDGGRKAAVGQSAGMSAARSGDVPHAWGTIPGRLSETEMQKLARGIFRTMGGGEVLSMRTPWRENYFTAYGYTVGITRYKKVNGRRINLNVAASYDEERDVTRVILGSPIIKEDF